MTDNDDCVLVDDNGYPTERGLQGVREFCGSPRHFVGLLEKLWCTPTLMSVEDWLNAAGKVVVRVRLATGGWSGNEQVVTELDGTFFRLRFWESSHRGGLHVYDVPKGEWEAVSQLGAIVGPGAAGQ